MSYAENYAGRFDRQITFLKNRVLFDLRTAKTEAKEDKIPFDRAVAMNECLDKALSNLYPITVVSSRYGGCYEGGSYLAFNLEADSLPEDYNGDDTDCSFFFGEAERKSWPIGRGSDPTTAVADLKARLKDNFLTSQLANGEKVIDPSFKIQEVNKLITEKQTAYMYLRANRNMCVRGGAAPVDTVHRVGVLAIKALNITAPIITGSWESSRKGVKGLAISVSLCHQSDNFCSIIGVKKALDKLANSDPMGNRTIYIMTEGKTEAEIEQMTSITELVKQFGIYKKNTHLVEVLANPANQKCLNNVVKFLTKKFNQPEGAAVAAASPA